MSGQPGRGRSPSATDGKLSGRNGADHRLRTYRTPGGDLMCLANAGALSSEMRVSASFCGTDAGCRGMWLCFLSPDLAVVSKN